MRELQTVEKPLLSNVSAKNVGAIIDRPAVECYVFAETTGKIATIPAGRSMSAPTNSIGRCLKYLLYRHSGRGSR